MASPRSVPRGDTDGDPLRRRTLGQPLLLGLRVRAMATRDRERICAADPGFSLVPKVEAALAE
ncbi:MAG: hypothetical protein LLG08_07175 [Actinomycetia bacterium]|nr:hypothetical protein [Actinomycetes bacterium]